MGAGVERRVFRVCRLMRYSKVRQCIEQNCAIQCEPKGSPSAHPARSTARLRLQDDRRVRVRAPESRTGSVEGGELQQRSRPRLRRSTLCYLALFDQPLESLATTEHTCGVRTGLLESSRNASQRCLTPNAAALVSNATQPFKAFSHP